MVKTKGKKLWSSLTFRLTVIALVIAILIVFRFVEDIGVEGQQNERFVVDRIIDGDTFVLAGGDRVRLLSIDTPEKGEPYYKQATQFLSNLVLDKVVRIEYASRRRDKYGRLLAYVYIDSLFVNKTILENGLGYLYLFKDTDTGQDETKILLQAQRSALKQKVSLWSLKREEEDYYIARPNSYRFHRPGCWYLRKSTKADNIIFKSREDALWEGLSPCRRCQP
ncbi:MAG: thermonuclease family protein [candidate division Zixibacteria bacterium]|nr:thermonuclease family protein [candidate division Zixibacteria bacterium]